MLHYIPFILNMIMLHMHLFDLSKVPEPEFPRDLIYNSQPMQPSCLPDLLDNPNVTISLEDCHRPDSIVQSVDEGRDLGFIGYRYGDPGDSSYRSYKYLGKIGISIIILARADDGGNVTISNLLSVHRNGKKIQFLRLEKNYGCGNYVDSAFIFNEHIYFSCVSRFSDLIDALHFFDGDHRIISALRRLDEENPVFRLYFMDGILQSVQSL